MWKHFIFKKKSTSNNDNDNDRSSDALHPEKQQIIHSPVLEKAPSEEVIIRAFDKDYKLNKKILCRKSSYFNDLINLCPTVYSDEKSPINNTCKIKYTGDVASAVLLDEDHYKIPLSDLSNDLMITQNGFELMLRMIFGSRERYISSSMMATANYFGVEVDMNAGMTYHEEVVVAVDINKLKSSLIQTGWKSGPENWDGLPISSVLKILEHDYLFIPDEYHRAFLIIKLLERRKEPYTTIDHTCPSTTAIKLLETLLNQSIIFANIPTKKLIQLKSYNDINGIPYIFPDIIQEAIDHKPVFESLAAAKSGSINSRYPTKYKFYNREIELNNVSLSQLEQQKFPLYVTSTPPIRLSFSFTNLDKLLKNHHSFLVTTPFYYGFSYWDVFIYRKFEHSNESNNRYRFVQEQEQESARGNVLNPNDLPPSYDELFPANLNQSATTPATRVTPSTTFIGLRRHKFKPPSQHNRIVKHHMIIDGLEYSPIQMDDICCNDYYERYDKDGRKIVNSKFTPKLYNYKNNNPNIPDYYNYHRVNKENGIDNSAEFVALKGESDFYVSFYAYPGDLGSNRNRKKMKRDGFKVSFKNILLSNAEEKAYHFAWNGLIDFDYLKRAKKLKAGGVLNVNLTLGWL